MTNQNTHQFFNELFSIGLNNAERMLNDTLERVVALKQKSCQPITTYKSGEYQITKLSFNGDSQGNFYLLIPKRNLDSFHSKMINKHTEISIEDLSKECTSILANGLIGTLSNFLDQHITFSAPEIISPLFQISKNEETLVFQQTIIFTTILDLPIETFLEINQSVEKNIIDKVKLKESSNRKEERFFLKTPSELTLTSIDEKNLFTFVSENESIHGMGGFLKGENIQNLKVNDHLVHEHSLGKKTFIIRWLKLLDPLSLKIGLEMAEHK